MTAGYIKIEARWEVYNQSEFFGVETLCGGLEDGKKIALDYIRKYHPAVTELEWLQGVPNKHGPVYYANHKLITFRISQ